MVYIFLALGLFLLFIGGDWLVDGSVAVARRLKVSPLLIGLTLVGFGTSTPELVTSLLATFKGSEGISVGNVVGSNIANILLVLGVAALLNPVEVKGKSFRRDAFFLFLSTLIVVCILFTGEISRNIAIFMILILLFYIVYSYITEKEIPADKEKPTSLVISLVRVVIGILFTLIGAKLLVDNSVVLARSWGISETIIGLTIVAIGTSLPELATSIMSAIKKHNDISFGNVVGSNIYNSLFILGMTALFMPVKIPQDMKFKVPSLFDMQSLLDGIVLSNGGMLILVTTLMLGIAFGFKKYSRITGAVFLILYAIYIVHIGGIL